MTVTMPDKELPLLLLRLRTTTTHTMMDPPTGRTTTRMVVAVAFLVTRPVSPMSSCWAGLPMPPIIGVGSIPIRPSLWPIWPWIVTGIFWIWGLAHPDSLFPVYRIWLKFGHVAGWINTRIILGIMFYLVFFPFGVLMRLFGKDPMSRKLDSTATSYRILSDASDKDHYERPY